MLLLSAQSKEESHSKLMYSDITLRYETYAFFLQCCCKDEDDIILPLVVLLLYLGPDFVLIHHLLGGGDRLKVEGGQAVNEPGLLLLDGDPGIVLLGINQGRLRTLKHQQF